MAIAIVTTQGACNSANPSSSVSGTTITIVPRTQVVEGAGPLYNNVACQVTGVNGITPIFKIGPYVQAAGWQWDPTLEPGWFSYDGLTWTKMGNTATGDGNFITCSHTSSFVQDTVWFARQPLQGSVQTADWIATLNSTYPGRLSQLTGGSSFVFDTCTANGNDELGRAVADTPCYGFGIYGGHSRVVILTGGVHSGEAWARWCYRKAIEFILGASMEAKILRGNFNFACYPEVNSPGVDGGNWRGVWDAATSVNDPNRHWNDSPGFEVVSKNRASMLTELSGKTFSVSFDYHGTYRTDFQDLTWWAPAGSVGSAYSSALQTRLGYTNANNQALIAGQVTHWAANVQSASLAILLEHNQGNTVLSDALAVSLATPPLLTLVDMLMQGKFGATTSRCSH